MQQLIKIDYSQPQNPGGIINNKLVPPRDAPLEMNQLSVVIVHTAIIKSRDTIVGYQFRAAGEQLAAGQIFIVLFITA